MKLQQIIDQFRIEADDMGGSFVPIEGVEPAYLFSNAELIMYANEAEEEAAIRSKLIWEGTSTHLTQIDVRAGVMSYPLDDRMFEINYAEMQSLGQAFPIKIYITSVQEMDSLARQWRTVKNRPSGVIHNDTTLLTNSLPDAAYTVRLNGYRLPIAPMGLIPRAERLARGTVMLTGVAGSVNTLLVNGIDVLGGPVAFNVSLAQTATDVAARITGRYTASAVGAVVTIFDIVGTGDMHNGYQVVATVTGLTTVTTPINGGVDAIRDRPEINAIHHRHLVKWMLYRAFKKPDAHAISPKLSAASLAEFEEIFGQQLDAQYRRDMNASQPHRTVAYP
jgi:hypothetical protein